MKKLFEMYLNFIVIECRICSSIYHTNTIHPLVRSFLWFTFPSSAQTAISLSLSKLIYRLPPWLLPSANFRRFWLWKLIETRRTNWQPSSRRCNCVEHAQHAQDRMAKLVEKQRMCIFIAFLIKAKAALFSAKSMYCATADGTLFHLGT